MGRGLRRGLKRNGMSLTQINSVRGRRVWDSRGRPTVEVEVALTCGKVGRAIAPAGASTGSGEARDLRDGGHRLGGFDVQRAVANVNGKISALLAGRDAAAQAEIDAALIGADGTSDKSELGGNAMVATSLAVLQAAAAACELPLWRYLAGDIPVQIPMPEIQIFGGGAHAGRRVEIQDFMVVCPSASSAAEALDRTAEVYYRAGALLKKRALLCGVADEGGYWPAFQSNEQALELLTQAISDAGFDLATDVAIALDVAASDFGRAGRYDLVCESRTLDSSGMVEMLLGWLQKYPIVSVEDPLAEDDETGFSEFLAATENRVQVVGDDLLVTNAARIDRAAQLKTCNAALIKPNQAGTVSEAKAALAAGSRNHFATIVSARSGETEDTSIVHLAIGWGAEQLKVGSIARGERTAKWNELLRIEQACVGGARLAKPRLRPYGQPVELNRKDPV
jgi:enolase